MTSRTTDINCTCCGKYQYSLLNPKIEDYGFVCSECRNSGLGSVTPRQKPAPASPLLTPAAPPTQVAKTPPHEWDDYAMAEAAKLIGELLDERKPRYTRIAALHVALIEAMWFGKGEK